MKCAEAMRSLEDARREFASRYMHWLLAESARECDSGYARIRRFPSPVTLRFLDFVETDHSRSDRRRQHVARRAPCRTRARQAVTRTASIDSRMQLSTPVQSCRQATTRQTQASDKLKRLP
jgi:hypothetical protein